MLAHQALSKSPCSSFPPIGSCRDSLRQYPTSLPSCCLRYISLLPSVYDASASGLVAWHRLRVVDRLQMVQGMVNSVPSIYIRARAKYRSI